jgi:hypothetical protein
MRVIGRGRKVAASGTRTGGDSPVVRRCGPAKVNRHNKKGDI